MRSDETPPTSGDMDQLTTVQTGDRPEALSTGSQSLCESAVQGLDSRAGLGDAVEEGNLHTRCQQYVQYELAGDSNEGRTFWRALLQEIFGGPMWV